MGGMEVVGAKAKVQAGKDKAKDMVRDRVRGAIESVWGVGDSIGASTVGVKGCLQGVQLGQCGILQM